MSNENTTEVSGETVETAQSEQTDWKAEARKWESRSKENHEALETVTGERDKLTEQVTALTGKVTEFEKLEQRRGLVADVSKKKGVPADALRGSTREELEAHADVLADLIKAPEPVAVGQGMRPPAVPVDETREFAKRLFNKN